MKYINKVVSKIIAGVKRFFIGIGSNIKKCPANYIVTLTVVVLAGVVIVPSIVKCAINRDKAKCENHMYVMLNLLSDELNNEALYGGSYWHDLIRNGNYQKLTAALTDKTGGGVEFPSHNYYIKTGENKLSIICKKHNDISEKTISFSLMPNVYIDVPERPRISERIAYLKVTGPDTYYQMDSLDSSNPSKMVFKGMEIDEVINNLKVTAVYYGGTSEELDRSRYTVFAEKLDMSRSGQTRLIVKSNSTSVWDNSLNTYFIIDVIGSDDIMPLIIDGGIYGKYKLASWEWNDYVEEAAMEDEGKTYGASIIRYKDRYYYYPDGLRIVNKNKNDNPFKYALDTENEKNKAYYIEFDASSVVIDGRGEDSVHNGSVKVEDDLIYIWQNVPSKELDKGWIRVYCDYDKY